VVVFKPRRLSHPEFYRGGKPRSKDGGGVAVRRPRVIPSFALLALFVTATAGVTRFVVVPMRQSAQESVCQANLQSISQALQSYHATYGAFPPAYTTDAQGRPMHSWRALILPFAGEAALYQAYRFDEAWDGPNNSRLAGRMPALYRCPAHARDGCSSYAVVVGPETAFPAPASASLAQITDGPSVLVCEVEEGRIPWLEPRDLALAAPSAADWKTINEFGRAAYAGLREQGLAGPRHHSTGPYFLSSGGQIVSYQITGELVRAMLTINGSEVYCIEKL
jgi:hypothetical protein